MLYSVPLLKTMPATNLPCIQDIMIQYGMTTYLALGVIGNICNCIVFIQPIYRRRPSSIYFLSLSIIGILHLAWSIFPMIYSLYRENYQNKSVIYCKTRIYGSHVLGQCLRSTIVISCIDRYIVTQTSIRIRTLHSIPMAIRIIIITYATWFVVGIHIPIGNDIRNGNCGMIGWYKSVFTFYQMTVCAVLPPILMIIFGIFTIRTLYQRHLAVRRTKRKDRHLMRMVMVEVFVYMITSTPYSITLIYGVATYNVVNKSMQRLEIESFINFLGQFFIYSIGVTPFYLFMLTSKPFRKEFIRLLNKCRPQKRRIVPSTVPNVTRR